MMRAALDQLRANVAAVEQRQAEATTAAESFDPEAFRQAEETKLADAAKAASATLKSFKDDADGVATKLIEAQAKALTDRAERVKAETTATLETLRADLDGY